MFEEIGIDAQKHPIMWDTHIFMDKRMHSLIY